MDYLLLLLLVLVVAIWIANISAQEQALKAARVACDRHAVQLLDETVLRVKMRPRRAASGSMRWQRDYTFEFTTVGDERRQGTLTLFAGRVVSLTLDLPESTLYEVQ